MHGIDWLIRPKDKTGFMAGFFALCFARLKRLGGTGPGLCPLASLRLCPLHHQGTANAGVQA